jgi:hypothetical protein
MTTLIRSLAIISLLLAYSVSSELLAQPTVNRCESNALAPGKTVDVVFFGDRLERPLHVWHSFVGTVEVIEPLDENGKPKQPDLKQVQCRITVDANQPPEIVGLVFSNSKGNADVFMLCVDDLPRIAEDGGKNTSFDSPQVIDLPGAIDGVCDSGRSDYYKFHLKKSESISVDVLAGRIGSALDPVVRLYHGGKQLILSDDDPGLGADCRFAFQAPADDDYILEILDNKFAGGQRYRIRIGDFPLVSATFPIALQAGQKTKVEFLGKQVEAAIAKDLQFAGPAARKTILVANQNGLSSAALCLVRSNAQGIEQEPNDSLENATDIVVPGGVNARFAKPGDVDHFRFPAKKGQLFSFRPNSRSLGLPTIPFMQIYRENGQRLAESKVNEATEISLSFTAPDDGNYILSVEDLLQEGSSSHGYHIDVVESGAFLAKMKFDPKKPIYRYRTSGTRGGFFVDIELARDGYNGPVLIESESNAGLKLLGNVIPANSQTTRLLVLLPEELPVGEVSALTLRATATEHPQKYSHVISSRSLHQTRKPMMGVVPNWLNGTMLVSKGPTEDAYCEMTTPSAPIFFAPMVGRVEFDVAFQRKHKDFKENPPAALTGLPPGIRLEVKPEKDKVKFILTGGNQLAESEHNLVAGIVARIGDRGQGVVTGEFKLQVITPVAIEIAEVGELVAGQSQKVKIVLRRKGPVEGNVELRWKKLPPNVSGEPKIVISENQTEIETELTAAAVIIPGTFDKLQLEATYKYSGKNLKVESAFQKIELKAKQ